MAWRNGFALFLVQLTVVSMLVVGLTVGPGMYVEWFTSSVTSSEKQEAKDLTTEMYEVSFVRQHLGRVIGQAGKGRDAQDERYFFDEAVRNYNADADACDDTVFTSSGLPRHLGDTELDMSDSSSDSPT